MKVNQIRDVFLHYFESQNHEIVTSSSLVPADDPTLLFTNAGMVPFKEVFLGSATRAQLRATSSQKCLRAGGKHNDLENVGMTARHHTFFEMLGNFSFGDYFKSKAIHMAWELVTEKFQLPRESLLVTVYQDDDEAYNIWRDEIGIDPDKIIRCGEKDNFWSMGDTGPCGPCSEIFYDHGPDVEGGPPGSADEDKDRFVEIWNLVFMQYDRQEDGQLLPLPRPCVDTGMGIERMAAVLQGVHNNFDIDLFQSLIRYLHEVVDVQLDVVASRVIVDHLRAMVFLINDQVYPSNEGRGYVLRRIMRRAIRFGYQGGVSAPFLHKAAVAVVREMQDAYPELQKNQDVILQIIEREERLFFKTIAQGYQLLTRELDGGAQVISGELAFRLYDTYGFPIDIVRDIAKERAMQVDEAGFTALLSQQRQRSKENSQFKKLHASYVVDCQSQFTGYEDLTARASIHWIGDENGQPISRLEDGAKGMICAATTPFYPEGGGQVGDSGRVVSASGEFRVETTQKNQQAIVHIGQVIRGHLAIGDDAQWEVASEREETMRNHSATHLLHAALREILGAHVVQRGSLVDASRLRFDFSHFQALSLDEIQQVEARVNEMIRSNAPASSQLMPIEQAKQEGVMALFDEKYEDEVRVMRFGDFSGELCGGTHVAATGQIGYFCIVSQASAASGIRRIEALTGAHAIMHAQTQARHLIGACEVLKCSRDELIDRVQDLKKKKREVASEAAVDTQGLLREALSLDGVDVVYAAVDNISPKGLRDLSDQLREKSQSVIAFLRTKETSSAFILCLSNALVAKLGAKRITQALDQYEGITCRGGGKDHMVQGKVEADPDFNRSCFYEVIKEELAKCH